MEEKIIPAMTKRELYDKQMELLKMYLERGAISKQQYDKSVKDLKEKMGFGTAENK